MAGELFLVLALRDDIPAKLVNLDTQGNIPLSWSPGMVGACPVFLDEELAAQYIDSLKLDVKPALLRISRA